MLKDLYRIFYNPELNQYQADESKVYSDSEMDDFREKDNKNVCENDSFFEKKIYALDAVKERNQLIAQGYLKICKDCGRRFWQDENEIEWFASRDLFPPKRCPSCRRKRKASAK